jgi:hypothetical protein
MSKWNESTIPFDAMVMGLGAYDECMMRETEG